MEYWSKVCRHAAPEGLHSTLVSKLPNVLGRLLLPTVQDLMRVAPDITNVVESCTFEGRQERLENMQTMLEQCEKALQEYLETKRVAFPRFYFVSPADLLDILSKGSNPQLILRHLQKCFDNIDNLSFRRVAGTIAMVVDCCISHESVQEG